MNLFRKLHFIHTHFSEIDTLLENVRKEEERRKREEEKDRLNLCYRHRQEQNHSHYSEVNCDYCKLLNRYRNLIGHST